MAMKKKGYAKGGVAKKMAGGAMKKKKPVAMKSGGKMPMVKKNGKSVPAFAADGVGKMKKGGAVKKKMGGAMMMKKKGYAKGGAMKKKGYAKGGVTKKMSGGTMARGSGAARPQRFRKNG
jgi:hypothetical protein